MSARDVQVPLMPLQRSTLEPPIASESTLEKVDEAEPVEERDESEMPTGVKLYAIMGALVGHPCSFTPSVAHQLSPVDCRGSCRPYVRSRTLQIHQDYFAHCYTSTVDQTIVATCTATIANEFSALQDVGWCTSSPPKLPISSSSHAFAYRWIRLPSYLLLPHGKPEPRQRVLSRRYTLGADLSALTSRR